MFRFADKLISAVPESEQRNVKGKKKVTLFFSRDIDHNLKDDLQEPDFFIKSLRKVIIPIRKVMNDTNNSFSGSSSDDCQKNSIPVQLLSLVTMIIDKEISQHALTCAQLLMYNLRPNQQKSQGNQLPVVRYHNRKRETPVVE